MVTSETFTPQSADAFLQRFVCFEGVMALDAAQAKQVREALLLLTGLFCIVFWLLKSIRAHTGRTAAEGA